MDRLIEQLWDGGPPDGAAQAVRSCVARLRRALGDAGSVVVTKPPGYVFDVGEQNIDAFSAEALVSEARQVLERDPTIASRLLTEASGLWRGDAYGEFGDLDWLRSEVHRLGELRRAVVEAMFEARLAAGSLAGMVGDLEVAVGEFPLSEHLRLCLMEALARSGRGADASRAFHSYRQFLAEETGLEPGIQLKQLDSDILTGAWAAPRDPTAKQSATLPSRTVTFLFTDIEGSTRLWADDADGMGASLGVHDAMTRNTIESHVGRVFSTAGDSFGAVFESAHDAVRCAVALQESLSQISWPGPALRVRMGLHLGDAGERGGGYEGSTVSTAARVEDAGHGGQILITEAVRTAAGIDGLHLGVHQLRQVAEPTHLYQLGDTKFPPLRVVTQTLSTLPSPATSLVGREDDILRIRTTLLAHRLVTLTGAGGCGKTRLAVEVAERELFNLEHGVCFADLSVVSDHEGVLLAVADAILLSLRSGDPLTQIVEHLADKQALVVLDNCEHVVDACADFAEAVLSRQGEWRLLATSREHLDVSGEQVLRVPSLSAEDHGSAAELFEARASAVNADFVVDDSNRSTVIELCERLDGMPLAIELAAARSAVMTPTELLNHMDDRFRLLSGGHRRSRDGRRALKETLDWSYDLLDGEEQALLVALGVFRGPFDLGGAAAVGGLDADKALDLLESLVNKSLVVATTDSGVTLFRMLETVRAYAEEHLQHNGDLEGVRHRHLNHYVAAVGQVASAAIAEHGAQTSWDWATARHWTLLTSNLDAAIDWAIACDRHVDAGELLVAASSVWREHLSTQPILDRIDHVRAEIPERCDLHDRLLIPRMHLVLMSDDRENTLATATEAVGVDNHEAKVHGLAFLAIAHVITDPDEALRLAREGQRIDANDMWPLIHAYVHMLAGDVQQSLAVLFPLALRISYLVDGTAAALLLMDERPSEALDVATGHPATDSLCGPFMATVGLCHLALGDREAAERQFLADAREAAFGRTGFLSNNALVGLAALIHHDGDAEWAAEVILRAGMPATAAIAAVARMVAEQIGVRDEYVVRQMAAVEAGGRRGGDATEFLRETLTRWEAQREALQV